MPAVDGFGQRTNGIDSETGEQIELLDLATPLVEHTGFVTTLGERVARFAAVRHASYVHLRRLDRPSADRLELVSDFTPGWRLSELLDESSARECSGSTSPSSSRCCGSCFPRSRSTAVTIVMPRSARSRWSA